MDAIMLRCILLGIRKTLESNREDTHSSLADNEHRRIVLLL